MRYALLTSPENFVDEIDLTERLFDSGLDLLYILKPNLNERSLDRFLLSLPEAIRKRSFLCGSPSKAAEFDLAGFHVSADWCVRNADAALRALPALSVYVREAERLREIPGKVREKISEVVVESVGEGFPENALVSSDATALPENVENFWICSGIWEFADPVSAWRRLCKK